MTCKAHAAGKGYVMAVKEGQPKLVRARTATGNGTRGTACSVQRRLYRAVELAGLPGWESLRQGGASARCASLRRRTRAARGPLLHQHVPVGRLSPAQILRVVREHWSIESDCNWTWCLSRTTRRCVGKAPRR